MRRNIVIIYVSTCAAWRGRRGSAGSGEPCRSARHGGSTEARRSTATTSSAFLIGIVRISAGACSKYVMTPIPIVMAMTWCNVMCWISMPQTQTQQSLRISPPRLRCRRIYLTALCFQELLQFIYDTSAAIAHAHPHPAAGRRVARHGAGYQPNCAAVWLADRLLAIHFCLVRKAVWRCFWAAAGNCQFIRQCLDRDGVFNRHGLRGIITPRARQDYDAYFPVIIGVRAVKRSGSRRRDDRRSDTYTTMTHDLSAGLPRTSLIICSRNRPKLLAQTVRSILKGDEVPTELIIIDQSADRHEELADLQSDHGCTIRYLWGQSVGISRARNAGIAASQYDILAMTDDDIISGTAWLRHPHAGTGRRWSSHRRDWAGADPWRGAKPLCAVDKKRSSPNYLCRPRWHRRAVHK